MLERLLDETDSHPARTAARRECQPTRGWRLPSRLRWPLRSGRGRRPSRCRSPSRRTPRPRASLRRRRRCRLRTGGGEFRNAVPLPRFDGLSRVRLFTTFLRSSTVAPRISLTASSSARLTSRAAPAGLDILDIRIVSFGPTLPASQSDSPLQREFRIRESSSGAGVGRCDRDARG